MTQVCPTVCLCKFLLEYGHAPSFPGCPWLLSRHSDRWKWCDRDWMAHNAKIFAIYSLTENICPPLEDRSPNLVNTLCRKGEHSECSSLQTDEHSTNRGNTTPQTTRERAVCTGGLPKGSASSESTEDLKSSFSTHKSGKQAALLR